jgi:hypothetical protein
MTFCEFYLMVFYSFFAHDEVVWGMSKNGLKLLILSQMLSSSATSVKRVLLDPTRKLLTLPTDHWRRRGAEPVCSSGHLKRERTACILLTFIAVAFGLHQVFPSKVLSWILIAGEVATDAFMITIYWGNVDLNVLRALGSSYEVVMMVTMSVSMVLLNVLAGRMSTIVDWVDAVSFVMLGLLFSTFDALRQRSLWFRRFCLTFFLAIVFLNLVRAQFVNEEFNFQIKLPGAVTMTKSLRSLTTTCILQIITLAVPAITCVISDKSQSLLALVRCAKPRPLPIEDSFFSGWWRPSF